MNTNQVIIKMMLDRWNGAIKYFDTVLNEITDEQLQKEIAPGKNRGIYLLGHLIAVHDDMLVLLDMGDKLFPELSEPFIKSPDKLITVIPAATTLREYWKRSNEVLTQRFNSLKPEEWFQKHTAVTAEDFSTEPHRNKLNILLTRTTHLTYHTGQFVLLK
jgi:DinB superfamily